jgi:hypothetical protein
MKSSNDFKEHGSSCEKCKKLTGLNVRTYIQPIPQPFNSLLEEYKNVNPGVIYYDDVKIVEVI